MSHAPQAEFRQGLGREAARPPQLTPPKPAIYRAFLPPVPSLPQVSQIEAGDCELREAAHNCRDLIGEKSKGSRRPVPIPTYHDPDPRPISSDQNPCKFTQINRGARI